MDRRRKVAHTVYLVIAADTVLLMLFALVVATVPADLEITAGIFAPTLLAANYLFLRRRLRQAEPPETEPRKMDRAHRFWLYVGAGMLVASTVGCLVAVLKGSLPNILFSLFPFYLYGAFYLFRMARKAGRRR